MSDENNGEHFMQVNDGAQGERVVRVNYPANSYAAKGKKDGAKSSDSEQPAEKKVNKIVTGDVTQRKKGLGRKIAETFTADKMSSVGGYILQEVVLPQIKNLLSDAVSQGVDRTLFGESRRGYGGSASRSSTNYGSNSRSNYTSYNRFATNSPSGRAGSADGPSSSRRTSQYVADIEIPNRGEAESVLDEMNRLIGQYEFVTVADLYDLVGITGAFTDEKWGWDDLHDARIRRVSGGFLLELPRPQPIDK